MAAAKPATKGGLYEGAIEVLKRLSRGERLSCISAPKKVESLPIKFTSGDRKTVNRRTVERLLRYKYIERSKTGLNGTRAVDMYYISEHGRSYLLAIRKRKV
jgi:hypothetical protein